MLRNYYVFCSLINVLRLGTCCYLGFCTRQIKLALSACRYLGLSEIPAPPEPCFSGTRITVLGSTKPKGRGWYKTSPLCLGRLIGAWTCMRPRMFLFVLLIFVSAFDFCCVYTIRLSGEGYWGKAIGKGYWERLLENKGFCRSVVWDFVGVFLFQGGPLLRLSGGTSRRTIVIL